MEEFLKTRKGVLFKRDCLEVLPRIESNTIDCVFADPSFNLGKDYKNGYNDNRDEDHYLS
jgi:site-specific DNA-methyltransferase (adenine-specific)